MKLIYGFNKIYAEKKRDIVKYVQTTDCGGSGSRGSR
jgi:hypothetical protein